MVNTCTEPCLVIDKPQALHIHGVNDHVKVQLSFLAMLIYEATVSYSMKCDIMPH